MYLFTQPVSQAILREKVFCIIHYTTLSTTMLENTLNSKFFILQCYQCNTFLKHQLLWNIAYASSQ